MAQNQELPPKPRSESQQVKGISEEAPKGSGLFQWFGGPWRIVLESIVAMLAVVLVLFWLAGTFHSKVSPDAIERPVRPMVPGGTVVEAKSYSIPRYEWAIGSIQAVHETSLGAKILAKVKETNVKAGQPVREGEVLMRLDDADLKARVDQATAAIDGARAAQSQAKVDYDRIMNLAKQKAATDYELTSTQSHWQEAKAKLAQAEHALDEAKTVLTYSVIRAPFDGLVIDKKVEAGDTVVPGQIFLKLYDPKRMQLVATVRESLARNLQVGQPLQAYIPAMSKLCAGTVAEIVPQAQAESRSFDVKVVGPCAPGIYTGMFGRLLIPLGEEQVILIPQAAVENVGQLKLIEVVDGNHLARRSIQTGRTFEDYVEALSGLAGGENIWVPRKIPVSEKKTFTPTYLWEGLEAGIACPTSQPK
ncbi:MAG: efflux RND transporter periplasmic adaptor subunit [Phycisphaerae bacterium]